MGLTDFCYDYINIIFGQGHYWRSRQKIGDNSKTPRYEGRSKTSFPKLTYYE